MNRGIFIVVMLTLLVLTLTNWGIAYENTNLKLKSGDTYQFYTNIQNMEDSPKNITVHLTGDKIAETVLKNEFYILQSKTKMPFYITIKVPENPEKRNYKVIVLYTASPTTSGIGIATEKSVSINIEVLDYKEEKQSSSSSGYGGSSGDFSSSGSPPLPQEKENKTEETEQTTSEETEVRYEPREEQEVKISGTGVGVTVPDPNAGYIQAIIILAVIGIAGAIVWKFELIEKMKDYITWI